MATPFTFYEFFAGGGMARAGLGAGWRCLYANDFDPLKAAAYRANWGGDDLYVGDVWKVEGADLPGRADLAWASSPCQDLSLAGKRAGLSGARSSAFWGFWRLMKALAAEGRAPRTLVIENVAGLLTSHGGADFTAVCQALADGGYRFGALEIDAALFLPQSRPRLFLVATLQAAASAAPSTHPRLAAAHARLPQALRRRWVWWPTPTPPARNTDLASVLEADAPTFSPERTAAMLALLSPLHRARLDAAPVGAVGALYRRIRIEDGRRVQRAEVRFDGLAGCLRTPKGGSSRQFVVFRTAAGVQVRPLAPREGGRLMGLADGYILPPRPTAAFHVIGDGVAVPVVRWLASRVIETLLAPPKMIAAE